MTENTFNKTRFSLHCNGLIFTPRLVPSIILLIALPILITLGCWQLSRYQQKLQIEQRLVERGHLPALLASQINQPKQQLSLRRVMLLGHYDNKHQILLDNRHQQHQVGYEVLTPLQLEHQKRFVLVNRGWVKRNSSNQLPQIKAVNGLQTIIGRVKLTKKNPFIKEKLNNHWPLLIQDIDIDKISQRLKTPLYPFIIRLSPDAAHGFKRQWQFVNTLPEKHLGYAIQWFALGLTLVIIYIVLNTRRGNYETSRKEQR